MVGTASVRGFTNSSVFFGGRLERGGSSASLGVVVEFAKRSQSSHIAGLAPIIHIGELELDEGPYQFVFVANDNASARFNIATTVGRVRGLMVSLPVVGTYRVTVSGFDGSSASLCHENDQDWHILQGETFFDIARPCVDIPPEPADATAVVVVGVVSGVLLIVLIAVILVALKIRRDRRAKVERARQAEEDGLNMQSLAGTDFTFYE
jgi:hypothetical protein